MLWLAGLMGMVGVGAAAFVVTQDDLDDDLDEDIQDDESQYVTGEDLTRQIDDIFSGRTVGEEVLGYGEDDSDDYLYDFISDTDPDDASVTITGFPEEDGFGDIDGFSTWPGDAGFSADGYTDLPEQSEVPPWLALAEWVSDGAASEPMDYDASRDSLVLVWDDTDDSAAEPEVTVQRDGNDPEVMHVMMNGQSVAEVYGDADLSVADLTVVPLSSAMIVGLEPA
ncbi:hypothetical protein [Roseobacter sp. S98]|uniref:hypothetical protein n=1 Tax=Roseobacter algicola (ex Choi et al. 2025) (nom. illeg.) TaxID=3092138 RepID=UPI0035C6E899